MPSFPIELVGEMSPDRIVLTGLALIVLRWLWIVVTADARRRVAVADARAGMEPARRAHRRLGQQNAPGAEVLPQFLESDEEPEEISPRRSRGAPDSRRRR